MSKDDLDCRPHYVKDEKHFWWYEEPKGIRLVTLSSFDPTGPGIVIPWSQIRKALARLDKK